jgi:hypothetical protein
MSGDPRIFNKTAPSPKAFSADRSVHLGFKFFRIFNNTHSFSTTTGRGFNQNRKTYFAS